MRFGKTLQRQAYTPWKDNYIDYVKLKKLLREDAEGDDAKWTDADEERFSDELFGVELEKVFNFYTSINESLKERIAKYEKVFASSTESGTKIEKEQLEEALKSLDSISEEMNQLEKYSRANFAGFSKIVKKHDRRRGNSYKLKPMMQLRLAAMPFNQEDYTPFLYRLQHLYSFVRSELGHSNDKERMMSVSEKSGGGGSAYHTHKYFVHPDNLLEVKTYILRHLPVLVYNPNTAKIVDANATDPLITSLYFDNPQFSLYTAKVDKQESASSLRLRWYGALSDTEEIALEKKTITGDEDSEEISLNLKEKYIDGFLKGENKLEKQAKRLQERFGEDSSEVKKFEEKVKDIQSFIKDNQLQPMMRATYSRTAYQIPGDNAIRISLDTNLSLIREDTLDVDRPCREPEQWHRTDITESDGTTQFSALRKGEISRFPYAVLEVRIDATKIKARKLEWLKELDASHLVTKTNRFSKFVHGVAVLFDDYVNTFPFWMSLLETDIRKDPKQAFEDEQALKAQQEQDDVAVGSFIGSVPKDARVHSSLLKRGSMMSTSTTKGAPKKPSASDANKSQSHVRISEGAPSKPKLGEEPDSDDDGIQGSTDKTSKKNMFTSLFPSFSTSKYALAKRNRTNLPAGVRDPGVWIKDSGPLKVEAKVWLANERTFVKWQHITILLSTLGISLYNAAGTSNTVSKAIAISYTLIALFCGFWGWFMYSKRERMIRERSGADFDNKVGPIVVCVALIIAVAINFGLKYAAFLELRDEQRRTPHVVFQQDGAALQY